MYTKSHLVVSAALGAVVAVAIEATLTEALFLVGYAAFIGTVVDLDHFLIARLRAGDWRHLRFAVANPRAAVVEQDRLFEEGDVGRLTRLLSHALLGGAVVVGLIGVDPFLALFSAVVLYAHAVCDLVAGVRTYEPLQADR